LDRARSRPRVSSLPLLSPQLEPKCVESAMVKGIDLMPKVPD